MSFYSSLKKAGKYLLIGTGVGLVSFGSYNAYLKLEYQHNWSKAEDARQKVAHPKIKTRLEEVQELKKRKEYDLIIIGGGATGAGIAVDAASRGLKVALVEKEDFGGATSGRSTKLVHGGVRYLEKAFWNLDYGQYKLVKDALYERYIYLKLAPHLTTNLPIMIPLWAYWQVAYYWAGVKAYDLIAMPFGIGSSYVLGKQKALEAFPVLRVDKLKGAVVYYDGQTNDARMNVLLACTAAKLGADLANHVEVTKLYKNKSGEVKGVYVRDVLTGDEWQIRAKGVINATGPFSDSIRKMDDPQVERMVVPSAGTHIILPDYYSPRTMGLLDPATSDGRVIFFLPWENSTIAGTTDSPVSVTDRPKPMEDEIQWILREVKEYLSSDVNVQRGDVLSAWTGIRPLVKDPSKKDTQNLSRDHVIHISESGKLLTIAGGKWTTYRRMAEEAVDTAIVAYDLTPVYPHSRTEYIPILGAQRYSDNMYIKLSQQFGLERVVSEHLSHSYGDRAFEVAGLAKPTGKSWPVLGIRIADNMPYIEAEIKYACRNEFAATVIDVIGQRTRLAFVNSRDTAKAVPNIAAIMADELGWDEKRKTKEITDALKYLKIMGLDLNTAQANNTKQFNALQLVKFREAFQKIDKNDDGVLSVEELREAFSSINIEVSEESLNSVIRTDTDGGINFSDFVDIITDAYDNKDQKSVLTAFPAIVEHYGHGVVVERSGGGL